MKVILLEKLGRLGKTGEVVDVKPGYARNYLLPAGKALRASNENLKQFESQRTEIEAKNAAAVAEAQGKAKAIEGTAIALTRPASEEGKLFGSVTIRDIAESLAEAGHPVEKRYIQLPSNIRQTGDYIAQIEFHAEVIVPVTIAVKRTEAAA